MEYLTSTKDEIANKYILLNNRSDIADLLEVKLLWSSIIVTPPSNLA